MAKNGTKTPGPQRKRLSEESLDQVLGGRGQQYARVSKKTSSRSEDLNNAAANAVMADKAPGDSQGTEQGAPLPHSMAQELNTSDGQTPATGVAMEAIENFAIADDWPKVDVRLALAEKLLDGKERAGSDEQSFGWR